MMMMMKMKMNDESEKKYVKNVFKTLVFVYRKDLLNERKKDYCYYFYDYGYHS